MTTVRAIRKLLVSHGDERINLAFDLVGSEDSEAVSGKKPPVILLHGVTNSKETWKNMMLPFAESTGRKVYAYDARNHGDSTWSDDLSYEVMTDDLYKFLEGLRVPKAALVGHSMGGKVAMYFALKWPDKVEKIVVEDISPKPAVTDTRSAAKRYVQLLRRLVELIPSDTECLPDAKEFVHRQLHQMAAESGDYNKMDSSLLPLTQNFNGRFLWKTNLNSVDSFLCKTVPEVQGTFAGPVLFLWGTKSPYKVTDDRDFILKHFPGSRFRAIDGASHQIHQFYKDLFLEEAVHFIN